MSYRQISDILNTVSEFHEQLTQEIRRHSACNSDPRLDLLTDYVKHQRDAIARVVRREREDSSNGVLQTWLQYTPEEEIRAALKKLELREGEPVEALVTRVVQADQALRDLYKILSEQTSAERVREFFKSLRDASLSFARQRSWGLRERTN